MPRSEMAYLPAPTTGQQRPLRLEAWCTLRGSSVGCVRPSAHTASSTRPPPCSSPTTRRGRPRRSTGAGRARTCTFDKGAEAVRGYRPRKGVTLDARASAAATRRGEAAPPGQRRRARHGMPPRRPSPSLPLLLPSPTLLCCSRPAHVGMQPSLEGEKKMVDQLPLVTLLTFATAARTSARAMSSESSASSSLMSAKGDG